MNCTRCTTPLEDGDLRCAVCAAVRATDAAGPASTALTVSILRCTECGAAMAFSAEAQAPRCGFCGAVTKVEQPVDPLEKAEIGLPFAVDRAAATGALKGWLGSRGWLRPKDLSSNAAVETLEPLRWAAWVVEARALVSWAADSDLGSHRSAWAPHAGQVHMDFDGIVVPASRGLTHKECSHLTPHYRLETAAPIEDPASHGGSGGAVEEFDAQRSAARRTVVEAIEATAAGRLAQGTIPGSRFRNVKVSVLLEGLRTRRVALPAWVLAYRYRGNPYRAVIHGQNAQCITGQAPYSTPKLLLLIGGAIALIALILALVTR